MTGVPLSTRTGSDFLAAGDPGIRFSGVPRTASEAEMKAAYRKLAKKLHPDLHPGDKIVNEKFKEVSAAYDLLSDADKRARYDRGEIDADGNVYVRRPPPGANMGAGMGAGMGRGGAARRLKKRPPVVSPAMISCRI